MDCHAQKKFDAAKKKHTSSSTCSAQQGASNKGKEEEKRMLKLVKACAVISEPTEATADDESEWRFGQG